MSGFQSILIVTILSLYQLR